MTPVQLRSEGAHTLHTVDQSLQLQLTKGTVHRHAADTELLHQRRLGRHQGAGVHSPAASRPLRYCLTCSNGASAAVARSPGAAATGLPCVEVGSAAVWSY